ncbi:MAG TPA: RHS repeat-associated core domain-containing protein [Bacteroidales bacterium]|nr:RHS repeat-associated core domain-containing protein [Bacteroidales bacterium]
MKFNAGFFSSWPDSMYKFGNLFRHWGQFSYFSHDTLWVNPSKLYISNFAPDTNSLNNADFNSIDTTSSFDDVSNMFAGFTNMQAGELPFTIMFANHKEYFWDDFLKSGRINNNKMISQDGFISLTNTNYDSSFDEELPNVDLDEPYSDNTNGNSFPLVIKHQRQTTNTFSFSTKSPTTSVCTSVSYSKSKGFLDYLDMNGDRYPDVVSKDYIQYSTSQGGLESGHRQITLGYINCGHSWIIGNSFGVLSERKIPTDSKSKDGKIIYKSSGIGSSNSEGNTDWLLIDINGDGLPDMIDSKNNTISYNIGYDFLPALHLNVPSFGSSRSYSYNISNNYNNKVNYSWAFGFGASNNSSISSEAFIDVNNDGLMDICQQIYNTLVAYINNGNGFSNNFMVLNNSILIPFSGVSSNSVSTNGAFSFPLSLGLKFIVSPMFEVSYNITNVQSRIIDINGDNTVDLVYIENNEIKVKYGIPKKVNLLKKVITPLKSSYTVNYEVSYPTAQSPSSRWVMSSLKTYDGFAGDGVDTLYYTFTYDNPYYHRMERDFFGFEKVTTKQVNDFGLCMRSYEDKYLNNHYLFKGLKKYEVVKDNYSNKFVETYYTYDYKDIPTGNILNPAQISCSCIAYPAISQEDKYYYEGQSNYTIHTMKTYRHGPYGNIKEFNDFGDVAYTDDDIKAKIYYKNYLMYNLTGLVDSITVFDAQNTLLQKRSGTYNSMGKLTQISNYLNASMAAVTDITYDTFGNITHIEYPANVNNERLEYTYVYDSIAYTYPTKITDYWGNVSRTLYDLRWGLPLVQTDMGGNKIQYGYYNDGKLKYVTGPYEINTSHHTIDCEYWDEEPGNNYFWARTWHFDPMDTTNRMLTVNFADGLKRNIQSKRKANVYGTDKFIVSGRVYFDNLGRVVENHLPVTESFGNDSLFNRNDNSYYSTLYYDILDRPTKQILPDNTVYNYSYGFGQDFFGNTCFAKTTTDPKYLSTTECTNAYGFKTTVFAQLSATTAFVYNQLGQLIQSRDPEDNYTFYQYDMLGRMTQRTHPDAGITRFTYDLAGNVLSKETQNLINNNEIIQYIYDDNHLVNIVYPENPAMNVYYEYGQPNSGNQSGRLVKQQDVSGAQTFTYGKLGELIQNTHTFVIPHGGDALTFSTSWDYDTWGRTKSITYPDGETVYYGYDHGGNLITMNSVKGNDNYYFINDIRYNEFGKRSKMYYNNGVETKFEYNPANQRLATLDCSMGDAIQHFAYSYDDLGNITRIENTSDYIDVLGGSFSYSFNYDDLYRLIFSEGSFSPYNQNPIGYKNTMEYTASGNIYRKSLSATTLINGNLKNIGYDRSYQYNSRPHTISTINSEIDFTWDANGNMTHKEWDGGLRSLCWDEENRLTSVFDQTDEMQLSMYLYDCDGNRAWKFAGNANLMQINGQNVLQQTILNKTLYVNPYMVVTENDYTKHFFIENERVATKIGCGFNTATFKPWDSTLTFIVGDADSLSNIIDGIINRQAQCAGDTGTVMVGSRHLEPVYHNINGEEEIFFYHSDHLGSTGFVTDAEAKPVQHLQYLPFGELFVSQVAGNFDSRYKFTGKERDEETGYDYFGARYYDSDLSQWLSVDPMSDVRPNISPYVYCQNNPVGRIDPNGALDGDFISESGKYLGNDGINDGKVYIVKTTQTTANINDKHENPNTIFAGITTSERDATESFIKSNSGNTTAFQENDIAYRNSIEIIGDVGLRQRMVEIVCEDDGKGLSSNPSNNREFGGNISNGSIIPASPSAVGNVKSGSGVLAIDLLGDSPSFHSHASGTYSPMLDFNSYGQSVETKFWYQSPSSTDISNAGSRTNYVFGRGNGTVYIYNSQGVQATIPQKYFVNPRK